MRRLELGGGLTAWPDKIDAVLTELETLGKSCATKALNLQDHPMRLDDHHLQFGVKKLRHQESLVQDSQLFQASALRILLLNTTWPSCSGRHCWTELGRGWPRPGSSLLEQQSAPCGA